MIWDGSTKTGAGGTVSIGTGSETTNEVVSTDSAIFTSSPISARNLSYSLSMSHSGATLVPSMNVVVETCS